MQNGIILRKSVSFVKKCFLFPRFVHVRIVLHTKIEVQHPSIFFTANLSMTSLCIFRAKPQSSIKDI